MVRVDKGVRRGNMKFEILGRFGFVVHVKRQDISKAFVNFKVEEIISRLEDGSIYETEDYLECTIKWDSCSHFDFGDKGYIHICGYDSYKKHIQLMEWLYKKAFELMEREPYDESDKWRLKIVEE